MVRLSHVALAVSPDTYEDVKERLKKVLRVEPEEKELPHAKLRVALFKLENATIELLTPTAKGSDIDKFLHKRGNAVHHIALQVESVSEEVDRLESEGFTFASKGYEGAKGGEVAFIHPKATGGFLVELVEEEY
ncbi:MAG: methylmalonyl-CoA epimerase [Thermotogae bacterium]|nr:methylmalonyl-CoA epimerase [Thermotogota bacterium]